MTTPAPARPTRARRAGMTRAYALALGAGIHPDQAALHGLLVKVRDLGVTLLSVELVEPSDTGPDGRAAEE